MHINILYLHYKQITLHVYMIHKYLYLVLFFCLTNINLIILESLMDLLNIIKQMNLKLIILLIIIILSLINMLIFKYHHQLVKFNFILVITFNLKFN